MYGTSLSGLSKVSLLVTLGLGYIICYLASKTDKTLRTVGYIVGIFIMTLSVIFMLCHLLLTARICSLGMMKGQMQMPPSELMPPD